MCDKCQLTVQWGQRSRGRRELKAGQGDRQTARESWSKKDRILGNKSNKSRDLLYLGRSVVLDLVFGMKLSSWPTGNRGGVTAEELTGFSTLYLGFIWDFH